MRSVIGYNNFVLNSSVSATSFATGMPGANLQDETGSPSMGWQTVSGVLTGTAGAVVTIAPSISAQTWRVVGIFRTNLTRGSAVTFDLFLNASIVYHWQGVGPNSGYGQVIHVAPADIIADYLRITIDDPGNPDGFINVPLCFAGPAWMLLSPPSYETTIGSDSAADEVTSRGGQEYRNLLWTRRRMEIALAGLRQSEILSGWAPLDAVARSRNNILFIPDADSDTLYQEAIYGLMTATSDVGFPYGSSDRRSWRARITERL